MDDSTLIDIEYYKDLAFKYKRKYKETREELGYLKQNSNLYHVHLRLQKLEDDLDHLIKLQQPKPYQWDSLEELIYNEKPFATACRY